MVNPNDESSGYIFRLNFHITIHWVVILIQDDYELDLSTREFAGLLGYDKKVLASPTTIGARSRNRTWRVDWVYIHCDLISWKVDDVRGDVLFTVATSNL